MECHLIEQLPQREKSEYTSETILESEKNVKLNYIFSVCGFSCGSRDEISNGGLWRTWKNYVPARRRPIQFVRVFLSTEAAHQQKSSGYEIS